MENISELLKNQAVGFGLCKEWTAEWGNPNKDELVQKFVRGIDFCIEHNYPSVEFLKENFDGVLQKYGVYAKSEFSVFNEKFLDVNNSFGSAKNNLHFDTDCYVRNNSELTISAMDSSSFHISIYDNSILNIRCFNNAKVYVYKYGGTVNIEFGEERVFIREKSISASTPL